MGNAMEKSKSILGIGVSNQQPTGVNSVGRLVDTLRSWHLLSDKRETNAVDEFHHHHESLNVENLENSSSSKLQLNDLNEIDLNEYCLLEIFSYLSIEDMIQVEKVCKKWYQVSQQYFKQVQTFVYDKEEFDEDGLFQVYEKYYKRQIYEGSEAKKLIPILNSCGEYIKYYKVLSYIELGDSSDENEKFLFQWVPKRCQNIVDVEIHGRVSISVPWNFEIMATHWKKLEKISIQYNLPQGDDWYFTDYHYDYAEVFGRFFPSSRLDEIIKRYWGSNDKKQLNHFISASKNLTSLKSLELSGFKYFTDVVVAAIANIKSITHLSLTENSFESRRTYDPIASMKGLKSLDLSYNSDLREDSLINIVESCTQLEQFYYQWDLTNEGMTAIAKLKKLKCLEIAAHYVTNESILSSCGNLEVLLCCMSKINNSDAIKLLKKATNLKFVGFFSCYNLTEDILQAANEIANERKNILSITTLNCGIRAGNIDTPYFKYFRYYDEIPMEIFPKDISNIIKERLNKVEFK